MTNILTDDLRQIMFGSRDIDVEDWKKNTIFEESTKNDLIVIDWFWESIKELDNEQTRSFLIYTTGCGNVPARGFESLVNNRNEKCLFTIILVPLKQSNQIESFTCFNRINLPCFASKEDMKNEILEIVNQKSLFFGLE